MNTLNDFKVGEKVLFGRAFGEKTLGEIVKINRSKLKVKQLDSRGTYRAYPAGTVWTVPVSLCTKTDANGTAIPEAPAAPKPKRSEAEIMQNIRRLYNNLSPENLCCDGEISRSMAARRGAAFRRELKACFAELGRQVSESEAYRNAG
jgi:hypothetical protein